MTIETRKLSVQLSEDERRERANELAAKIGEGRRLESDRKAAMSDFKKRDQDLRTRVDQLSDAVQSGAEMREVDCRWTPDERGTRAELVRTDTGEVIESRVLSPAERQRNMFDVANKLLDPKAGDKPAGKGA